MSLTKYKNEGVREEGGEEEEDWEMDRGEEGRRDEEEEKTNMSPLKLRHSASPPRADRVITAENREREKEKRERERKEGVGLKNKRDGRMEGGGGGMKPFKKGRCA